MQTIERKVIEIAAETLRKEQESNEKLLQAASKKE